MEVDETHYNTDAVKNKETIEAVLARLQSLKCKVSELRLQCEELKKLHSEKQIEALLCNECGKTIRKGQEVTVKDCDGEVKSYYHRDCFKTIWSF